MLFLASSSKSLGVRNNCFGPSTTQCPVCRYTETQACETFSFLSKQITKHLNGADLLISFRVPTDWEGSSASSSSDDHKAGNRVGKETKISPNSLPVFGLIRPACCDQKLQASELMQCRIDGELWELGCEWLGYQQSLKAPLFYLPSFCLPH